MWADMSATEAHSMIRSAEQTQPSRVWLFVH